MSTNDDLPTVVLTGFGLFRDYKVNPSWEAVKRLRLNNCKLVIQEIAVSYEHVHQIVGQIWDYYKPKLVVHVGVSWIASCLQLETRAFGSQYNKPDIHGCIPATADGSDAVDCECIESEIDVSLVCQQINEHFHRGLIKMPAVVSHDAGRYLCEYIYYKSLKQDSGRTAFIHVPEISESCSVEDIASALQLAVQTLIDIVI